MKIVDLIKKKAKNEPYTEEEIEFVVDSIAKKQMPDYLVTAWLMAIYINGLSLDAAYYLTKSMWKHSAHIDLSEYKGDVVDKHSTGGIGDKVSLILLPIIASLGIPVAKISGRGLGFTGGTIDKLEAVGVDTNLDTDRMIQYLKNHNIFLSAQTEDLDPVDKVLYHLRDVTGTIGDYGLIASSILSKKFAIVGTHVFLDVKYGSGAFCPTFEDAMNLIKYLKYVAKKMGRKLTIIVSTMEQPLGRTVGNAIEVAEALEFLEGKEPAADLKTLIYEIACVILKTYHKDWTQEQAYKTVDDAVKSGKALDKFYEWLAAQGGNIKMIKNKTFFDPNVKYTIKATKNGYLRFTSNEAVGMMSVRLGAGRILKTDKVDNQAGLYWFKKWGDEVKVGDPIVECYCSFDIDKQTIDQEFKTCCEIVDEKPQSLPIIKKVIYDEEE